MDVFVDVADQGGSFFRDSATAAAHDLGVFDMLSPAGFISTDALAALLDVAPHRLGPLLAVLALHGHAEGKRDGSRIRWRCVDVPPRPEIAAAGLGLLADVLRSDEPIPDPRFEQAAQDDAYLGYLAERARESAATIFALPAFSQHIPGHLLDAGGGHGEYAYVWAGLHPENRATVIDRGANLDVARRTATRAEHEAATARVQLVDADLATCDLDLGADVALLGNVVHLHAKAMATTIARNTARHVRDGGTIAIKEVLLDELHRGPAAGAYFSLSLVAYTEGGRCYEVSELEAMLRHATSCSESGQVLGGQVLDGQVVVTATV